MTGLLRIGPYRLRATKALRRGLRRRGGHDREAKGEDNKQFKVGGDRQCGRRENCRTYDGYGAQGSEEDDGRKGQLSRRQSLHGHDQGALSREDL